MRRLRLCLCILIVFLLILRLCMPYLLKEYASYRINKIPGYRVSIADIDVHLYRGSYTIQKINLQKINNQIPVPFFAAEAIDLSIDWNALLHFAFVASVKVYKPVINFVVDPKGQQEQTSISREWEKAVKSLFPLNFNQIEIRDGKLTFRSFKGKPPFNLFLKNINFNLENMQNAKHSKNDLLSVVDGSAKTMDGAAVNVNGKYNPFSKKPNFYFEGELKNMQVNKANAFLKHFTNIDVHRGRFSLYVEVAAANGRISGYAKPLITDLEIVGPNESMQPVEAIYKGALQLISKILTNPEKNTIATRISIHGNADDPDYSLLSLIANLFRNAFIQAFLPQIDHSIKMQDVNYEPRRH